MYNYVGMGRRGLIIDHSYHLMKDITTGAHHAIMGHIDIAGTLHTLLLTCNSSNLLICW